MNSITLKPQHDYVLVMQLPQDMTEGRIAIPKNSKRRTRLGAYKVLAVGPGRWDQGGFHEPTVKEGDRVMVEPAWVAELDLYSECIINGIEVNRDTHMGLVRDVGIMMVVEGEDDRLLFSDVVTPEGMVA